MAVTVTTVRGAAREVVADVTATADADVAAVLAHGFGQAPAKITLTPLQAQAYVSTWTVGVVDATNVNLVKANAVGSGVAGAQIRVFATLDDDLAR